MAARSTKRASALQRAIDIVGSSYKLASAIKVPQSTIAYWLAQGRAKAEYCAAIERATGGKVSRRELRPDLFGSEK